jgi:methionyl-tRNA synthetase
MELTSFTAVESFFQANPIVFFLFLAWSLYWKGMALWKAARLNDQKWFVALLVINLVGILEILYIYFFSKKKEKAAAPQV